MFNHLKLAPKQQNELKSMGYVKYGVKVKPTFNVGDKILNTAHIYFDFNAAIVTNTTSTMGVNYPLVINENQSKKLNFSVKPNPTKSELYIDNKNTNEEFSAELYNIQGQLQIRKVNLKSNAFLSLQNLSSGVYILKVQTNKGVQSISVIKQ
jgi:ribosomal protein L11